MSGEVLAWMKSREVGKLYLTLHCRHQNNSALRWAPMVFMSHFSTSLIVGGGGWGGAKPKVSRDGTCSKCKLHLLKRKESRSRLEPTDLLTSLVPYCWAKTVHIMSVPVRCPFFTEVSSVILLLLGFQHFHKSSWYWWELWRWSAFIDLFIRF